MELSEPWISNSSSGIYNMKGYNQIESFRMNRIGEGVYLFTRDDLVCGEK